MNRYPPLLAIGIIAFLMIAVLPSSLILPQTNPATTLEYAPVPKGKDTNPPPGGNLSSLSLASSRTLRETVDEVDPPRQQQQQQGGRKRQASDKRCVGGNPPRQTEDPLAPPCVSFFEGNNFGETYQGVTAGEVTILYFLPGNFITGPTSRGTEHTPTSTYYNLGEPERDDDPIHVRGLRDVQRYFNDRYQTYNRFVRFHVYYDSGDSAVNPDALRAQAAENFAKVKPFAVFAYLPANDFVYLEEMATRGVLTFGSVAARSAAFYRRFPGLAWGYLPSVEVQAKHFVDFLCTNVVGQQVRFSGNSGENGGPRKLGLIRTVDPAFPGLQQFAQIVKDDVKRCSGKFEADGTTPVAYNEIAGTSPDYAYTNMAEFKQQQITTVVWAQGIERNQTKAASQLAYSPEWIVAGDRAFEGFDGGQGQDQSQWEHAWVASSVTKYPRFDEDYCYLAFREANPRIPRTDALYMCVNMHVYEDQRQLFTGIQVAGPKLTPASINQGFHAIPPVASTDPRLPSCYYDPGDYTCVKDFVSMWWDPQAQAPNSRSPGCWRMPEGGKRYLNAWPGGNVDARKNPGADPCNGYASSGLFAS